MPAAPPTFLALLLVALVVIMTGLATVGVNLAFNAGRSPERRRVLPAVLAAAGVTAWLTVTGVLASRGFFVDFTGTPPRFVLAVVPAILTVATISYLAGVGRPLAWLTAIAPARLLWM